MLLNYFKIAFRNLMKNKTFSFINIFGLATGLTSCMLITIYIGHELSYDSNQPHKERLYQLGTTFITKVKEENTANTPAPMAKALQQEFPEIEATTRIITTFEDDKTLIRYAPQNEQPRAFYETNGFLADPSFFKLFNYDFKEGNPFTALVNPNSVVISDEIAKKLFGSQPALNKIIHISSNTNGDYNFAVTGVFIPGKIPSHIDGHFFCRSVVEKLKNILKE
jgi:putative ABC transport system permease protein